MSELSEEQLAAVQAAGWTEDDLAGFVETLAVFRDGLPPRQRDALTAILATAGAAAGDDVQGYVGPVGAVVLFAAGELVGAGATYGIWKAATRGYVVDGVRRALQP